MRLALTAASLLLAVCVSGPLCAAPNTPAKNTTIRKQTQIQPAKPSWEQCYAMSRQRGFDHEYDEWLQSIQDCMEGKIPL